MNKKAHLIVFEDGLLANMITPVAGELQHNMT